MKKILSVIVIAGFAVSGCSTPITVLKNTATGQTVSCGGSATGSLVGGVVGYQIEKSNAQDCVLGYMEAGFQRVSGTSGADHYYEDKPERPDYPSAKKQEVPAYESSNPHRR